MIFCYFPTRHAGCPNAVLRGCRGGSRWASPIPPRQFVFGVGTCHSASTGSNVLGTMDANISHGHLERTDWELQKYAMFFYCSRMMCLRMHVFQLENTIRMFLAEKINKNMTACCKSILLQSFTNQNNCNFQLNDVSSGGRETTHVDLENLIL